jgi:LMBR1 domain-containing protein 1
MLATLALSVTLAATMAFDAEDFGPSRDPSDGYGYGLNTTTAPNVQPAKQLKKGLLAGGWIPFVVLIVVSFLFSITYVKYYQHKREKEFGSTMITTLALTTGLLTIALVPVDIYLVSSLKSSSGAFESWASPENIASIKTISQDAYFAFYGLSILFSFIFLPLSYFFFEEKDEVENTGCMKRFTKASMFTVVFLVVLGILLAIGGFALNAGAASTTCDDFHPGMNTTEWKKWAACRAKFTEQALTSNHGMNALFFAVGALCILGYLFFIFYTAVGMVVLPLNMIRSRGKINSEETEGLNRSKTVNRETSRAIKTKYSGQQRKMTAKDRRKLREVEEDERVTKKAEARVADLTGGFCGKAASVCRPFTFLFGILFFLLSIFLAICLTMTSADKLMQISKNVKAPGNDPKTGWNWKTGYSKTTDSLPNPIDMIFTNCSSIFPLDYIIVTLIVYYFVVASMTGVKQLGVRFCHLKMYKIRANRTVPQGLLFLAFILVFIILSLNIILMTLSPQYVSYGNQMYTTGVDSDFAGAEKCVGFADYPVSPTLCNSNAPEFQVIMSTPKGCSGEGANKCTGHYQIDLPVSSSFDVKSKSESDWDFTGNCSSWLTEFQKDDVQPCKGHAGSNATSAFAKIASGDFESCTVIMPCIETRLSALLNAFFFNYWFLGMIYYWANWGFLAVFYISLVYCTCKKRKSIYQSMINDVQEDLLDSDDDMADFKPSWA